MKVRKLSKECVCTFVYLFPVRSFFSFWILKGVSATTKKRKRITEWGVANLNVVTRHGGRIQDNTTVSTQDRESGDGRPQSPLLINLKPSSFLPHHFRLTHCSPMTSCQY